MSNFTELFNHPTIYDFIVEIEEKQYRLISSIITKFSPFFEKQLDSIEVKFNENKMMTADPNYAIVVSSKKIINLDSFQVDNEAAVNILKYMYGESLVFSEENIINILKVAILFDVAIIVKKCYEYMETLISRETLLNDIEKNRNTLMYPIYKKALMRDVIFLDKDKVKEFMIRMPFQELIDILSSDDFECVEDFVLDIVMEKMKSKLLIEECDQLISCVRLPLLSTATLIGAKGMIDHIKYIDALEYHIDPKNKLVQYRGPKEDRFAIGRYNHIYAGFELFSNHSHFDKPAIMESFQKQYLLKGMLSLEEFHNVSRYVSASTRLKINNNFVKICEKNIPKDGYVHFSENKLHLIKASGGHYDSKNSVALLISTKI